MVDDSCESDESVEPDYDDQIDLMINCSQTKKDQTCRKTDLEQPSEMTETEHDFDVAEKLGPEVAETIAKLVDGTVVTVANGQMSDDKFKEKMDRYARPKHLKVVVPRVNPEIWSVLDHSTRGADLKIQNYQKALCTAMYALTNIWQTIFTSDPKIRGLMKGVADSSALIQKTNHDLSMDRRGKILNAQLNKKYRKLGSAEVPITDNDMLFGNDLKAACANIDTTSKMGESFSQSNANKSQKFFSTKHILCKKRGLELETGFRKNLDILRQNERMGTESNSPQPGKSCLPWQRENRADLAAKPTVTTLSPQQKPVSKGTIPTRPFEAGRLRKFVKKWEEITSDAFVLNMVCGADIPVDEISDLQSKNQICLKNQVQGNLRKEMDTEIEKLLSRGVIEKSMHQRDEIIFPVFMVLKPDGSYHLILNLKKLNYSI